MPVFTSRAALKTAVDAFIAESRDGDCPLSQDGALINTWDVSAVTSMSTMFYGAPAFNQDLLAWNVSAVTTMYYMFAYASGFNQDLSSWDVSAVTNMAYMFRGATDFKQDLSA